jgi:hypothetical protein
MVKLLTSNFRFDAIRIIGFRSMKFFKNIRGLFENILRKFIIKRTVTVINKGIGVQSVTDTVYFFVICSSTELEYYCNSTGLQHYCSSTESDHYCNSTELQHYRCPHNYIITVVSQNFNITAFLQNYNNTAVLYNYWVTVVSFHFYDELTT